VTPCAPLLSPPLLQLLQTNNSEQVDVNGEQMHIASRHFEAECQRAASGDLRVDDGLNSQQFALLLLAPDNDAVAPPSKCALEHPLAHYWTATSHNSYCIGDQLTGTSSADAYRRQLLQGCRHVEIDCWDGSRQKAVVKHGHTFVTLVPFSEVAAAVAECAFTASELPVILSLEMHCSPKQQQGVAGNLIRLMGSSLFTYDDLSSTGRAGFLSPSDLSRHVMVKGKVKAVKGKGDKKQRADAPAASAGALSSRGPLAKWIGNASRRSVATLSPRARGATIELPDRTSFQSTCSSSHGEDSTRTEQTVEDASVEELSEALETRDHMLAAKLKQEKQRTDKLLASITALRAHPFTELMKGVSSKWALPISSCNEEKLLKEGLGLSKEERKELMGIGFIGPAAISARVSRASASTSSNSTPPGGVAARIAYDPPSSVVAMQRRTACSLVRTYPLGLRFSGANPNPLPQWLSGAQYVALNMTVIDVPLQLHHALFNGNDGFVLKPQELCSQLTDLDARAAAEDRWPPAREQLHSAKIEILSLHNCPKLRERRPLLAGRREECHRYEPELSGTGALPDPSEPSSPAIRVTLHPIGGFCAVWSSDAPPSRESAANLEHCTTPVSVNGLNASFSESVQCLAAEPRAVALRLAVVVGEQEVAYETCILSRLRLGFRVFRLRSALGTRIELAYLFVKISVRCVPNHWKSPTELRRRLALNERELKASVEQISELRASVAQLKRAASVKMAPGAIRLDGVEEEDPVEGALGRVEVSCEESGNASGEGRASAAMVWKL